MYRKRRNIYLGDVYAFREPKPKFQWNSCGVYSMIVLGILSFDLVVGATIWYCLKALIP